MLSSWHPYLYNSDDLLEDKRLKHSFVPNGTTFGWCYMRSCHYCSKEARLLIRNTVE